MRGSVLRILACSVSTWLGVPVPLALAQPATPVAGPHADADSPPSPTVEVTFRPWVVWIGGDVVAREEGTQSSAASPFRLREDAGISGPDIYLEGELTVRLTERGAIIAEVLLGSSSGTRRLTADYAYDDATFLAGESADTDVSLATWAVGYRRRLWEPRPRGKLLAFEGGIGIRRIGSSTTMRTATASDSDEVLAAAVPYLELGARVALTPQLTLLAVLQGSPLSIRAFSDEPARAYFSSAQLLAELLVARNFSMQAGFLYLRTDLRFRGAETDGDRADNRASLGVVGGTLGVSLRL